jgi:hypothetical protein
MAWKLIAFSVRAQKINPQAPLRDECKGELIAAAVGEPVANIVV